MTPVEVSETLARLGLTQKGFAELIGVGRRTAHRWASEQVPPIVETILRLLDRHPELVDELRKIASEAGRPADGTDQRKRRKA